MNASAVGNSMRRRVVPWLVWAGLVVAAVFLARDTHISGGLRAYAEVDSYRLGAVEVARVERVFVKVGERVHAGQIVASLNAEQLEKELALTQAERVKVGAEIAKAEAVALADQSEVTRQKTRDHDAIDRARGDAKTDLDAARAALKAVQAEIARRRTLVEQGLAGQDQLAELQIRAAELSRTVSGREAELVMFDGQSTDVKAVAALDPAAWAKTLADPEREELKVLDAQLALLKTRRDSYVLRAPVDGTVTAILAQPMAVAAPGAPILELAPEGSGRIVACIGEEVRVPVVVGMEAVALSVASPAHALSAKAIAFGPVGELPARCWRDPRRPAYGRTVILEVTPPASLTPGEAFEVRFRDGAEG